MQHLQKIGSTSIARSVVSALFLSPRTGMAIPHSQKSKVLLEVNFEVADKQGVAQIQPLVEVNPDTLLWFHGAGRPSEGTRRIEIRKPPLFRPTTSKFAEFSVPPLLEARTGLPPVSPAISGARLRASSATFASVPRTLTVSVRCSPGFSGEESASSSSPTKVAENSDECRFAHDTSTAALPGCSSDGGSTTSAAGEDASTIAGDRKSTRLNSSHL